MAFGLDHRSLVGFRHRYEGGGLKITYFKTLFLCELLFIPWNGDQSVVNFKACLEIYALGWIKAFMTSSRSSTDLAIGPTAVNTLMLPLKGILGMPAP